MALYSSFSRSSTKRVKLFSAQEREDIVSMLSVNPECEDLIQGTGGFRKMRAGRDHMGKRGGARIIYIFRNEGFLIFFVTAYGKNEKENMTKAERNSLAVMANAIFEKYRS